MSSMRIRQLQQLLLRQIASQVEHLLGRLGTIDPEYQQLDMKSFFARRCCPASRPLWTHRKRAPIHLFRPQPLPGVGLRCQS